MSYNEEHLDYFLNKDNPSYEVFFTYYNPWELINIENKETLKLILSWELKIVFMNDFKSLILLNKDYRISVSESISSILIN